MHLLTPWAACGSLALAGMLAAGMLLAQSPPGTSREPVPVARAAPQDALTLEAAPAAILAGGPRLAGLGALPARHRASRAEAVLREAERACEDALERLRTGPGSLDALERARLRLLAARLCAGELALAPCHAACAEVLAVRLARLSASAATADADDEAVRATRGALVFARRAASGCAEEAVREGCAAWLTARPEAWAGSTRLSTAEVEQASALAAGLLTGRVPPAR